MCNLIDAVLANLQRATEADEIPYAIRAMLRIVAILFEHRDNLRNYDVSREYNHHAGSSAAFSTSASMPERQSAISVAIASATADGGNV